MKNGWQLAVVDLDILKRLDEDGAMMKKLSLRLSASNSNLHLGDVVYICSVAQIDREKFDCEQYAVLNKNIFALGIPFANIWIPNIKSYGYFPLYALRPIVTEADAIEMEMKFSISLKDYVQ